MTFATRLAIAMILLVAAAVFAVGWLSHYSLEQAFLPRVLNRIESQSRLLASELEAYGSGARAEIASFRARGSARGMIDAHFDDQSDQPDHISEKTWRDRLATRLLGAVIANPPYEEYRVIRADGTEYLRVDRSGPDRSVRIVPDDELQKKEDRSYFQEAIKLSEDPLYVSPVDLNVERGAIEIPHVPTFRVAGALFGSNHQLYGIVVINISLREMFDRIRTSARPGEAVYAVGSNGDYLVHPDRTREFGSQLGTPTHWQNDFPYFAALTGSTRSATQVVTEADGKPSGAAIAPAILTASQWIGIIRFAPNAVFMAPVKTVERNTLWIGIIATLVAAALAVLLARSLTRPIGRLTAAVEAIGRGASAKIPTDATGETGVLARAFARTLEEIRAKTSALEHEVEERRRIEIARDHYAARERLFSAAVESSDDSIVMQTLDGIITGWNPAAERLYGYSAEEAVGKPTSIIVPDDRRDEGSEYLRRIASGEGIESFETVRTRKDGSPVEISLSLSPIRGLSGEIVGASGSARSLTEARQAERALQHQLEERRQIFDASQDLIIVMDSRGVIVQISPSSATILGYRPEEMLSHSVIDFIHADHLEQSRSEIRALRRGERPKLADTRFLHKDGREVWLSWLGNWSEQARRFFFVGRDMTEARLAQESLRESERLARNIVETALDAFVQTDENGSILNWNSQAEKLFGWRREEALGMNTMELVVAESDRDKISAGLKPFLEAEDGNTLNRRRELMCRRRDGKEFRAELSITALKRREGMLFNMFYRDLTDKIAAEERIRQAEKMEAVGQLTGGVAHDFNNILTVITGTIEILAEAVAKDLQLADIARMIDQAAARGSELTQHLLAFARKQPLQPREIDINSLIMDTAKLLRPTLGEQIQIESLFETESCVATVDPNQLTTALLNLAVNARDAMPGGGKSSWRRAPPISTRPMPASTTCGPATTC